jgi:hypothetical protein
MRCNETDERQKQREEMCEEGKQPKTRGSSKKGVKGVNGAEKTAENERSEDLGS